MTAAKQKQVNALAHQSIRASQQHSIAASQCHGRPLRLLACSSISPSKLHVSSPRSCSSPARLLPPRPQRHAHRQAETNALRSLGLPQALLVCEHTLTGRASHRFNGRLKHTPAVEQTGPDPHPEIPSQCDDGSWPQLPCRYNNSKN
eukprot:1892537-Rhodomonas_salina.1